MKILHDQELKNYNTIQIGGKIKFMFFPTTVAEIVQSITECKLQNLPFLFLAGGSNTVFPDETLEYNQAVICLRDFNRIEVDSDFEAEIDVKNKTFKLELKNSLSLVQQFGDKSNNNLTLKARSGAVLQDLVDQSMKLKSGEMVGLNRVPGTIGGAVVGNAGAYGTEIKDIVSKVEYIRISEIQASVENANPTSNQKVKIYSFSNSDCQFGYRDSIFKRDKDMVVVGVELELKLSSDVEADQKRYDEIATKRDAIYPKGYASPGSLFKNLLWNQQSETIQSKIPSEWVVYGNKLPVGKLLEELGLKGFGIGGIQMTERHPNIMLNANRGNYQDATEVVKNLQQKVKERFGINIEPEVLFVKGKFNNHNS